jgi:hypothetical protein
LRRATDYGKDKVHQELTMAISFDEINDYYTIADSASLTLPNDDWCIGIWVKVDFNTGTLYQYLLSTNYNANNEITLYLREVGASSANRWSYRVRDGDGTAIYIEGSTAPGADGLLKLIIIQRVTASNQVQIYHCLPNAAPVSDGTAADTNFNAINGATIYLAARSDLNVDRLYGSLACEFFMLNNVSLSTDEIRQLGRGLRIYDLGHIPSIYLQMFSADATLHDIFGSNDATRQDSPTTVNHAPVRSPRLPVGVL